MSISIFLLREMKTGSTLRKMGELCGRRIAPAIQIQLRSSNTGKNRLHEVSLMRCNRLTKSLQCISNELPNLPHYDDLEDVNLFLDKFERDVLEEH